MEAYKFETTIQEDGIIHIPSIAPLAQRRAEVFIIVTPHGARQQAEMVTNFLAKWRGFLQEAEPRQLKDAYLQEKYQ